MLNRNKTSKQRKENKSFDNDSISSLSADNGTNLSSPLRTTRKLTGKTTSPSKDGSSKGDGKEKNSKGTGKKPKPKKTSVKSSSRNRKNNDQKKMEGMQRASPSLLQGGGRGKTPVTKNSKTQRKIAEKQKDQNNMGLVN